MKYFASLIFLSLLSACGGGQTTARLEVTRSFSSVNPFGGGLVIHGEHRATGKKFSLSLDGSNERKDVALETGEWIFHAVAWDGNDANQKFTGTAYCGSAIQDPASNASVAIDVTTTGCSNLQSTLQVSATRLGSCGGFYRYTPSDNKYYDLNNSDGDGFCSTLPLEHQSLLTHYRVFALQNINGIVSPGFSSTCLSFIDRNVTVENLSLPGLKIPLAIRAYRSEADCLALSSRSQAFDFPQGLDSGNKLSFDHLSHITASPGIAGRRLILPSSITRRGKSPFTHFLPRILCGAGDLKDCISDPSAAFHVLANWDNVGGLNESTILRNTSVTSCPDNIQNQGIKFNIENCRPKDGKLLANITRNEFLCNQATQPLSGISSISDIYYRDGLVYVLTGNNQIRVYDLKGRNQPQRELFISSTSTSSKLAVGGDKIFIANGNSIDIRQWDAINLNYQNLSSYMIDGFPITQLEVSADGSRLFVSTIDTSNTNPSHKLYSYDTNSAFTPTPTPVTENTNIKKLQLIGPWLGVLTDTELKTYDLDSNGNILINPAPITRINNFTSVPITFQFDGQYLYVLQGDGKVNFYNANFSHIDFANSPNPATAFITLPNGKNITIGGSSLKFGTYDGINFKTTHTDSTGLCSEPINIAGKNIQFRSQAAPHVFPLFEHGLQFLGRRQLANKEHPFYLFQGLGHGDDLHGGGKLERVTNMLSSSGIAGLLPEMTCEQLSTHVKNIGPLSLSRKISDPFENKSFDIRVTVSAAVENIEPFLCVANDPDITTCPTTTPYDLQLEWALPEEKGLIRLKCGRALGTFETAETRNSQSGRELYLWNTENISFSRLEAFSLELSTNSPNSRRGEIFKLQKSSIDSLQARNVGYSQDILQQGYVMELERNTDVLLVKNEGKGTSSGFFASTDPELVSLRSSTDFSDQPAANCMANINTSILKTPTTGCSFSITPLFPTHSKQHPFTLDYMQHMLNNVGSPNAGLRSYFTLPLP